MRNIVKRASAGAVCGAALLFTGGMGVAGAQPPFVIQDGLVNVAIGDITILEDVNVAVGATVAAAICGVEVGPVAVLGNAVDADGGQRTVCNVPGGDVLITQNAPGQSEGAPGGRQNPGQPAP